MRIHKLYLLMALTLPFLSVFCQPQAESVKIATTDKVGATAVLEEIVPIGKISFQMPDLKGPVFPELTVNISDKGAEADEPVTPIADQTIMDVHNRGGGIVVIPKGKWKPGRIVLKSDVNFHLEDEVEVEFPGTVESYLPTVFTRHKGVEIMGVGVSIYVNGENNAAVTGKGIIYGPAVNAEIEQLPNGNTVAENDISSTTPVAQRIFDGMNRRGFYRPKTILPINCTNVLVEGIAMERSAFWNICPIYCENVVVRGIIVNLIGTPSGDGTGIESCENVLIEYSALNCGDDCFTLKAGCAEGGLRVSKAIENVVIRYSLVKDGHSDITCGSETAGGIENIYLHDCVLNGIQVGIRFKIHRNRAGGVSDILYENMYMTNVGEAFKWDLLGSRRYMRELVSRIPPRAANRPTPVIKDIKMGNFIVESAHKASSISGIPGVPCSNILIENGKINSQEPITAMNDVNGFILRNLEISSQDNKISILDGQSILLDNVFFTVPVGELYTNIRGEKSRDIVYQDEKSKTICIHEKSIEVKQLTH